MVVPWLWRCSQHTLDSLDSRAGQEAASPADQTWRPGGSGLPSVFAHSQVPPTQRS